jgi:hypothetical protein
MSSSYIDPEETLANLTIENINGLNLRDTYLNIGLFSVINNPNREQKCKIALLNKHKELLKLNLK